jgi:DNA primase
MSDPNEPKERVKSTVNLADYIVASGVQLKGGPVEFTGLCPFHKEKTPSFTVNVDKRFFHCFGCGVTGDVFEYVMRTKGLDFVGALKLVANSVGISLPEPRVYQPPAVKADGEVRGILNPEKFRALVPGGKVWVYLTEKRRLRQEMLARYSVGQTADGEAYAFGYKWWPPGLPRKEGAKARTEFCKVVKVDRVDGRKVEWREPKGGKNILFGMLAVPEEVTELVVAEGEIDAITWAQYGFPAVSVPSGASYTGWLDVCWDWLQRFQKIHISFDEDRAGRAKVLEVVQRLGMARTDIIRLPERNVPQENTAD